MKWLGRESGGWFWVLGLRSCVLGLSMQYWVYFWFIRLKRT